MKSYKHYIRNKKEKKDIYTWILAAILICLIVLGVLTVCGVLEPLEWKPDVSYPMANAKISWLQSYHAGSWAQ